MWRSEGHTSWPQSCAKSRRESLRWLILLTLNNARPVGAYEGPVLAVAQSEYPDATPLEIRRELDYLADRCLVTLDKQPSGKWFADLTRYGTDIAEYTIDDLNAEGGDGHESNAGSNTDELWSPRNAQTSVLF